MHEREREREIGTPAKNWTLIPSALARFLQNAWQRNEFIGALLGPKPKRTNMRSRVAEDVSYPISRAC